MDCESVKQELYVYLDREQLTTYRRWQITRHLGRCHNCQDLKEFQEYWRVIVASRSQDPVPDSLRRRVDEILTAGLEEAPEG